MRPRLHWGVRGVPACMQHRDWSVKALPPNTTTDADAVTCQRCQRVMAKAREKLTPRKVRR